MEPMRHRLGAAPGWCLSACALVVVLLGGACSGRPSPPSVGGPNIIIFLVDTLRSDHLGVFGYHRDTSPVLDRWAREAVVFEQAYSPTSWTKPATVSLLSGLDPLSHRVEASYAVIPANVRLLSERLKAGGYATFAAVTNPNVLPVWGFDRGFDDYHDLESKAQGSRADAILDYVTKRIPVFARAQPFFLYLHLLDPHLPYDSPAPFDTRFPREPAFPQKYSIAAYDGEIAFVDSQFERLLRLLDDHGLDENTMVIFTADHGEEILDHGHIGHGGNLFDEVVRVPLLIRFPRRAHAGTTVSRRVSLIDVVPTVISVLGQPAPSGLDGRDLTTLLDSEGSSWEERDLFLSLDPGESKHEPEDVNLMRGVLSGPYKYLRRARPIASESLFNIDEDPFEEVNLAVSDPDSRSRLAATLDARLASTTSGVHLRILSGLVGPPVGCEAILATTGRFVEVSAPLLEAEDRFVLSDDSRTLRLDCQLKNRPHPTGGAPPFFADEDGLSFRVSPPHAPIIVRRLGLADDRPLPLRAGQHQGLEAVPFEFDATAGKWAVQDVEELLGEEGVRSKSGEAAAYIAVVAAPAEAPSIPEKTLDRIRTLGYLQ